MSYPADVILVDIRSGDSDLVALEAHPLWATLPAVQAGQVFGWHAHDPPTYRFYSDALTDLWPRSSSPTSPPDRRQAITASIT